LAHIRNRTKAPVGGQKIKAGLLPLFFIISREIFRLYPRHTHCLTAYTGRFLFIPHSLPVRPHTPCPGFHIRRVLPLFKVFCREKLSITSGALVMVVLKHQIYLTCRTFHFLRLAFALARRISSSRRHGCGPSSNLISLILRIPTPFVP
jgi:hypothetical protein